MFTVGLGFAMCLGHSKGFTYRAATSRFGMETIIELLLQGLKWKRLCLDLRNGNSTVFRVYIKGAYIKAICMYGWNGFDMLIS